MEGFLVGSGVGFWITWLLAVICLWMGWFDDENL